MATKGEEDQLDTLLSRICKDRFEKRMFKRDIEDFLTKVDIPNDWKEEGIEYKLNETDLTYKSRYCCLEDFIKCKEEGFSFTRKISKEFFQELNRCFLENDSFLESSHRESPSFHFLEENVKIQGVVLQKSAKFKKASIFVKQKKQKSSAKGSRVHSTAELVLDVKDEDDLASWSHIKVGDIVEVTECRRKEGIALEHEVIRCSSRSEDEIVLFLEHLKRCIQTDGSTAAVIEIDRCHAVWDYTIQLPEERSSDQIICYILQITDDICSKAQRQMSHTLKEVLKSIEESTFFTSGLPNFVDKIIKLNNDSENCKLVRRFLEHILNASHSCSRRVLSMATLLAKHLVSTSQDHESAKESGQGAVDFLGKLASIIVLHLPGAQEQTEALQWRELPLIPVAQEIRHVKLKTDDLPVIKKDEKYKSEEEYLNTYFRLLREECFHKLKKGITNFVKGQSKFDQRDMMLYRIRLLGVSTHHENSPRILSIGLKYRMESQESIDYESSHWLKFGNLLCISFDATFQKPVWALVEKHICNQSIVRVTLCKEKAGNITEAQLITELQEMANRDEEVYMAESQTFYVAFAPAMDVLQHKDCVPFKEFLVDACKSMEPASYIEKISKPPDWGIIFEKDSLSGLMNYEEGQPYSLLEDFEALKFGKAVPKLDDTQLDAVELTLKHKLALIQGPPGTGKSFVGVNLVNLLISMNVPQTYGPILVVTYKNFALDHFLEGCLDKLPHDIKVVRIGTPADGSSEKLKKCTVYEVGRSQQTRQRFHQKRTLTGKLWAMQPKVLQAYMELKRTAVFDADMFLKEATEDQVRWLLRGADVDFAEVESLLQKRCSSNRRLKEHVERALKNWLPSQEVLDKFAREEQKPVKQHQRVDVSSAKSPETSPARSEKEGGKKDKEPEDPSDLREPSSEENERLLALDEEPSDEDDRGGHESHILSSQQSNLKPSERKLLLLGNKGLKLSRDLLDMPKLWDLDTDEKVRLVYVLQREAHKRASEEFQRVTEDYVKIHQKLQDLNNLHKIEVMRKCHVIGMTVTGAAMRANLLADIKPSVMIVEEAAEILEGQLVAVIPPSVQHLIMIGDHKQLKPMVHFDRLKRHHNLDLSMFERLVNCNLPYKQLGKQCRMIDDIAEVLRQLNIYHRLETNFELVKRYNPPECVDKPMYFWTHTEHDAKSKDSHSMRNSHEAWKITTVAETFCREGGVAPSKITVLCSYRGQVDEIRTKFRSSKVVAVQDIAVTTIDSFQGQENDIILISLVRSNKEGVIGYLKSMNRLCVAISRARCGLYLFGNHTHLAKASSKGWKVVSQAMRNENCLGGIFPWSSRKANLPRSSTGSPADRSSPSREQSTLACNININVSVGKDATVTQPSRTDISQQDGGMPTDKTFWLSPATPGKTGKIPVQDPQTPVSKSPVDFGSGSPPPFELEPSDKEARKPTQETKGEETTNEGSVRPDNLQFKQEPVQETENPKGFISEKTTTQQGSQAFSEADFEEFAKERPVQETEEPGAKNDEKKPENVEETTNEQRQESCDRQDFEDFATEKPMQETVNSTKEEIGDGKQVGDTKGKQDLEKREVEESFKVHPIQETEESSRPNRAEMKTFPVQEEASIQSGIEKDADPPQPAGQDRDRGQSFEEFTANKPLQETESSGKPKGAGSKELRGSGIIDKASQEREGKPVQESESPKTKKQVDDDEKKRFKLLQEKELEEFSKLATSPTKETAPRK